MNREHSLFKLLKRDHAIIAELMDQLLSMKDVPSEDRAPFFEKLRIELGTHTAIEEDVLYPVIDGVQDLHEFVEESYREHDLVKHLLVQLSSSDPQTTEWMAQFTLLKENVEKHVAVEEETLFPKIGSILDRDELDEIAEQTELVRDEYKAA